MDPLAPALVAELASVHRRMRAALDGLDADALDRAPAPGANSIAVLVTHTLGSELDWLNLANGRKVPRDREAEFRTRGRTPRELADRLDEVGAEIPALVRDAVARGLGTKVKVRDREESVAYCLLHTLAHSNEHVGHVELTRQTIAK